ncbi:hypothetical protein OHB39_38875 [Streptomyces sp. NBC_00047]|uniref:hypothetical protein n=1 Tax=Streptomyces sp. NBC_00047 TaxID=2975627 RepID=UPI0022580E8C|nr:hypothetical protein [Streptomyces sp. NBC_00047]MCX5613427.1 hypothetical protein [Streptomyces sp. NBC_00047]
MAATANVTHLARLVGCSPNLLTSKGTAGLVKEAATELGVAADSYLDHHVRGLLDGRPWLAAISYYDVPRFLSLLRTACWVVIAYLSGMRDSEIKHLQRGCVSTRQDPDGRVYRHELTSLAFKGETDPRGGRRRGSSPLPLLARLPSSNASSPRHKPSCSPRPAAGTSLPPGSPSKAGSRPAGPRSPSWPP